MYTQITKLLLIFIFFISSNVFSQCKFEEFHLKINSFISLQENLKQSELFKILYEYKNCSENIRKETEQFFYKTLSEIFSNGVTLELISMMTPFNGYLLTNYLRMLKNPLTQVQRVKLINLINNLHQDISANGFKVEIISILNKLGLDYNEITSFYQNDHCPRLVTGDPSLNLSEISLLGQGVQEEIFSTIQLSDIFRSAVTPSTYADFLLINYTPESYRVLLKEVQESSKEGGEKRGSVEILTTEKTLTTSREVTPEFPDTHLYELILSENLEFVTTFKDDKKDASPFKYLPGSKDQRFFILKSGIETDIPIIRRAETQLSIISSPTIQLSGLRTGASILGKTAQSTTTLELGTEVQIKSKEFGKIKLRLVGGPELTITGSQKGRILPYGFLFFTIEK